MEQVQTLRPFPGPTAESGGVLPVHAREQCEHLALGRAQKTVEELFQVRCTQPSFVRQPEHLAAIAHRAQYAVAELALPIARAEIVDPVDLAILRACLGEDVAVGGAVPALHRRRSVGDAPGRAFGIQLPALQVMGGGAFRQLDGVLLPDQFLHGLQLPQQEGQLVSLRQRADQQPIDVLLLLHREGPAFAWLAPALAHGYGFPAAALPGLVGGDDGRRRETGFLTDRLERVAGDTQFHGPQAQCVDLPNG
ncbi:hypothetical protein D9M68_741440 [compost metagenome]